ncbi:MAG: hypothetical protein IJ865_08370 [Clostridia bacterium]|nr:hypothetical protein [Clostridia bacterium]
MGKRLAGFLCVVAAVSLLSASAFAVTEAEWKTKCVNKTITETKVFSQAGGKEVDATLKAGTYVKTEAYDAASGMWRISYLSGEEVVTGYVPASELTIAIVTVLLGDGTVENAPEALAGDLQGIADYLNDRHADKTYTVEDGVITVKAGKEAPEAEEETEEVEEPVEDEAEETADEEGGDALFDTDVADLIPEPKEEEEEATPQATATVAPTSTPAATEEVVATKAPVETPLPADQFEVPAELKRVVMIGTNECLVDNDGEYLSVKTNTIQFGEATKKNKIIAYIKPNSDGGAVFLAEPNPKARELGYLKTGTLVGVIKAGSNYCRVYVDGVVGCVKSNLLTYMTVDKKPAGTGTLTNSGKIDPDATVTLISATSKGYIETTFVSGQKVTIWGKSGKYYEVEANGFHGYVSQSNLTEGTKLEGVVDMAPAEHISETPLSRTASNGTSGSEGVADSNGRVYNMHRDPYN